MGSQRGIYIHQLHVPSVLFAIRYALGPGADAEMQSLLQRCCVVSARDMPPQVDSIHSYMEEQCLSSHVLLESSTASMFPSVVAKSNGEPCDVDYIAAVLECSSCADIARARRLMLNLIRNGEGLI